MRVPAESAAISTAVVKRDPELTYHLDAADLEQQLCRDALEGLSAFPKSIPSKWFYDSTGSMLFDQITRLPEYYPTRCERQILQERASTIVGITGAESLMELGCGLSEKTRILLDAFERSSGLERFLPFDVDGGVLELAADELTRRYPALEIQGIVGDFERHLDAVEVAGRTLVIFLGSTIGNLNRTQRHKLLLQLAGCLDPGDWCLIGVDLVKDLEVIEAAYNDSAGLSAAFNLNMLSVLNSRLNGNFDPAGFEHVARFNPEAEQMEMFLRSMGSPLVRLDALDLEIEFGEGELLHTEISAKFRREGIEAELTDAGFEPACWWTDSGSNFALTLSQRT